MTNPDTVIKLAMDEEGYLEKSHTAFKQDKDIIYDKVKGAGSDNITKYSYEMHKVYPRTMDFPAPWCDAFIDWCFMKTYGVDKAQEMLCGNFDDYTVNSSGMYKNAKRWKTNKPAPGDQIFFNNGVRICHTGLVYKVDKRYVYTIEGNTSNGNTLVSNGGTVAKKKYPLGYKRISGYGTPRYDLRATCQYGDCNSDVTYLQQRLMAKGYQLQRYGVDGDFGNETLIALKMFMNENNIKQGMACTPECWEKLM